MHLRVHHAGRRALAATAFGVAAVLMLDSCQSREATPQANASPVRSAAARPFPRADRPVSQIVGNGFSSEPERDKLGEASAVMDLARIGSGMSVADLGAGEGYYTARLSARVGPKGRVLAEDIDQAAIGKLGDRVQRERLENVSIRLGTPDDPRLPADSFDRILLIHMYHEVREPYAFLWHLRGALRAGGRVVVVELDRAPDRHGMPPALLSCEFSSLGLNLKQFSREPKLQGYYAEFEAMGNRPAPAQIKPCRAAGNPVAVPSRN